MEPRDFHFITAKVREVAELCCGGRIVSVLEGGYGAQHAKGDDDKCSLHLAGFAACAAAHLRALAHLPAPEVRPSLSEPHIATPARCGLGSLLRCPRYPR